MVLGTLFIVIDSHPWPPLLSIPPRRLHLQQHSNFSMGRCSLDLAISWLPLINHPNHARIALAIGANSTPIQQQQQQWNANSVLLLPRYLVLQISSFPLVLWTNLNSVTFLILQSGCLGTTISQWEKMKIYFRCWKILTLIQIIVA